MLVVGDAGCGCQVLAGGGAFDLPIGGVLGQVGGRVHGQAGCGLPGQADGRVYGQVGDRVHDHAQPCIPVWRVGLGGGGPLEVD